MDQRIRRLRLVFVLLFGIVLLRLGYWQLLRGDALRQAAQAQYQHRSTSDTSRGKILSSDGFPLVLNQEVYTLYATPKKLKDSPLALASELAPFVASSTGSDEATVRSQILGRLSDTSKNWVALAKNIPANTKQAISALNLTGFGFDTSDIRYYPEASMAAHVLGFVGNDADGNPTGYFGIEGKFDLELKGKPDMVSQETDPLGRPIAIGDFEEIKGVEPRDVTLTIQRTIQSKVEEELQKGIEKYGAKSGDVIVMEPSTGKILAMAASPSYDPAHYGSYDQSTYRNPTVADSYEPGSTFKVLTVASGIDAGVIMPDTQCDDCGAPKTIGKYTIRTWNDQYFKDITMTDALAKSDNTAMMFVAKRLGKDKQIQYIHSFGIGQKTGVELQEESTPQLRPDNRWGDIDSATASFGQGIAVTPIQILTAVGAIANGGVLMKPTIVGQVSSSTEHFTTQPVQVRRVVSKQTADLVTQMMIGAAAHGDAKWALPKGELIAGKTGTAQIPVDGHYDPTRTIASFVGFAPADHPRYVMLVRLAEPQTSQWGSETAAPIWFAISKDLYQLMGIPATTP